RRFLAAGWSGAPCGGLADHLDVEELARDLDLVVTAEDLGPVLSLGRGSTIRRRRRLQPLAVLHQVAAGLTIDPLPAGEQRLVEGDQGGQAADLVLVEGTQHAPR